MLIKTTTVERITETDFIALVGDDLLPHLESGEFASLNYPEQPVAPTGQKVVDNGQELVDGKWQVQWAIVDKTLAELAVDLLDAANSIRADRNQRLAASDWTRLDDAPVDRTAWAIYRQALRDVPAQVGFPWTVAWPSKPE